MMKIEPVWLKDKGVWQVSVPQSVCSNIARNHGLRGASPAERMVFARQMLIKKCHHMHARYFQWRYVTEKNVDFNFTNCDFAMKLCQYAMKASQKKVVKKPTKRRIPKDAKLDEAKVRAIRIDPRPAAEIAKHFDVSKDLIWKVKRGRLWKWVK